MQKLPWNQKLDTAAAISQALLSRSVPGVTDRLLNVVKT
jgi:hypothetical protein